MEKYVVLSCNNNPEYLFYIPITVRAWKKMGWEPILFIGDQDNEQHPLLTLALNAAGLGHYYGLPAFYEYNSAMVAQISRLYAACLGDGYFMTGDIDMIPLSDYWEFDENEITVWGHDLTSYQHYPICYIGMPASRWREVMGLSGNYSEHIKRDLDSMPNARSEDPVKKWVVDQDLITERLNATQFKKTSVLRGTYQNGYPIGRVDRSAWTLEHFNFIDCHMPRGIWRDTAALIRMKALLYKIWPKEDFTWLDIYVRQFNRIMIANG